MATSPFLPIALGVGILLVASGASGKDKTPSPGTPSGPPTPPGTPGGVPFPGVPPGGIPGIPPGGIPGIPGIPPGGIPGGIPGVPGTPAPPAGCTFDVHLPEPMKQAALAALANPSLPAESLSSLAQIAESNGYPQTAACLRAEAARRSGTGTAPQPPPGFDPFDPTTWGQGIPGLPPFPGMPAPGQPGQPPPGQPPPPPPPGTPEIPENAYLIVRTLSAGDTPYGLAEYYTGDGSRFRELDPWNLYLGEYTGGDPPYPQWQPGVSVIIPPSWDPWSKPEPPPGT